MATTYKSLSTNDIVTTKTLLHEAIPITGTIVSGSYNTSANPPVEQNIKNYTHGQFQSVYDYPYLSSSANHIFDLSVGCHSTSQIITASGGTSARSGLVEGSKKVNIYNQMAQVLMGYDTDGNIRKFDLDGNLTDTTTDTMIESIFFNFARLLTKDEIKKGTFSIEFGLGFSYTASNAANIGPFVTGSAEAPIDNIVKVYDKGAQNDYRVNSPAGDYGILYASASNGDLLVSNNSAKVGLVFYQAGVAVIDPGLFHNDTMGTNDAILKNAFMEGSTTTTNAGRNDVRFRNLTNNPADVAVSFVSGTIQTLATSVRNRIKNISFNNTTELNSTVYFCRAHHNEFNYSTNKTYLTNSQINVKTVESDSPISYVTTVGLYSADNELLAVAKLSEPLRKDPTNELTLRVRLDY